MFARVANNDRASRPASDRNEGNTNYVTEQFRFMHVSAAADQRQRKAHETALELLSKLNIKENDPGYSQQLEIMTRELSGMFVQQQPTANQTSTNTANGAPIAVPTSRSSDNNESRRDRLPRRRQISRSRSPAARVARAAANRQNMRSKSPIASNSHSNAYNNMSVDNDDDEFFEAHSTIGSLTFDSPNPKHAPKTSTGNGNSAQKQHPTPNSSGRPPLATVHLSEMRNSPLSSPQIQASKFKFDKDKDKFNVGSSPPKQSKFGSPGKKSRSPSHRSSPATDKPQPQMAAAHAPFASPVPDVFHAPETFIPSSGRAIPTPQNILQNEQRSDATSHRQSAPAAMSAATAAAAASFHRQSAIPKTPFDPTATGAPSMAPDTAETLIKKKIRNTATPNLGVASSSPKFKVDLSQNPNPKARGKRGNTLRKGFNNNQTYGKTNGHSSFVFGLDGSKETRAHVTAATKLESPSNSSPIAMDTSPIFSPPLQQNQQRPQPGGISAQAQFSLGVGGNKGRSRRKEVQRRGRVQKNQQTNMHGPSQSTFDLNHVQSIHEQKLSRIRADILGLQDLGRKCYADGKYQEATRQYSEAIKTFKSELFSHVPTRDLLATLLFRRAAALLTMGAYESAVEDCHNGTRYVTDPRNKDIEIGSPDMNPCLRSKLFFRMGRSLLRLGKVDDAERAFSEAVESARVFKKVYQDENVVMPVGLENLERGGDSDQAEVFTLRRLSDAIHKERKSTQKCLEIVQEALKLANGCHDLHKKKLELLAELGRWREICTHCERFAASNVNYDGCLVGDLAAKDPFPDVSVAKYLRADFFQGAREDEIKGMEKVLDTKSSGEAILRLPFFMMPYYLRSLRLNERYPAEKECLNKLEAYIAKRTQTTKDINFGERKFSWLPAERAKMELTKKERDEADGLYNEHKFQQAASKYAECLTIDSGSIRNVTSCQLHAIVHANRAACLMALEKYRDAEIECTNALLMYPRYVKALCRRARCYCELGKFQDSIKKYKDLLDLVRTSKYNYAQTDLVFDDPEKVKANEIEKIKKELNDAVKARDEAVIARAEASAKAREKANAEAEERARQRQARNSYREQSRGEYRSEQFYYQGRENFYQSSHNTSRRSDRSSHQRNRKDDYGYKSKSSPGGNKTQGSSKETDDHYTVLGIDRRATEEQIKKAYKKMALKHHPDKNKDNPSAAENFLRIKDAYEILKDSHARRNYDSQLRRRRY